MNVPNDILATIIKNFVVCMKEDNKSDSTIVKSMLDLRLVDKQFDRVILKITPGVVTYNFTWPTPELRKQLIDEYFPYHIPRYFPHRILRYCYICLYPGNDMEACNICNNRVCDSRIIKINNRPFTIICENCEKWYKWLHSGNIVTAGLNQIPAIKSANRKPDGTYTSDA